MGGVQLDPWPLIGQVDCPVLVVEGEKSGNRGHIDLKRAARAFARGQFLRIERAGHLIPMERPRETTRIIRAFFESNG